MGWWASRRWKRTPSEDDIRVYRETAPRSPIATNVTCSAADCKRAARVTQGQIAADGLCRYHHDWTVRYGGLSKRDLTILQIRERAARSS